MELMNGHNVESSNWSTRLAPSKQVKLQEEFAKSRGLKVLFSSDTLFEVHDDSIHVVDVDKRQCSCGMWKPTGIPCRHGIAVFNCTNRSVYDYCSAYFTADSFRLAYSESIKPASTIVLPSNDDTEEPEDEQVLPPSLTRPPAMVQKKPRRCKSQGIIRRSVCCTKCKGVGHNKATCKEFSEFPENENGNAPENENGNAPEIENGNAPENEIACTSS
ncbi:Zinc finger, PMZ-type [Corchorus olitorius]|uniref:Zinc finger, PMZ-type n=1 Tax=Corchorus olitorius TaxID=93759 RepID=A0A1R3JMH4_9ROSI|nr:Zinc finger, PMZ-type [Corchorus olitorius]